MGWLAVEPGSLFAAEQHVRKESLEEFGTHPSVLSHDYVSASSTFFEDKWCNGGAAEASFLASPRVFSSFLDGPLVHRTVRGREQSQHSRRRENPTVMPGVRQEHGWPLSIGYDHLPSSNLARWEESSGAAGQLAGCTALTTGSGDADVLFPEWDSGSLGRRGAVDEGLYLQQHGGGRGGTEETSSQQLLLDDGLQCSRQQVGFGKETFHTGEAVLLPSEESPLPYLLPYAPNPALEGSLDHGGGTPWNPLERAGGALESTSCHLSDVFVGLDTLGRDKPLAHRAHVLTPEAPAWSEDCTPLSPPLPHDFERTRNLHGLPSTPPRYRGCTPAVSMEDKNVLSTTFWTGQPPCSSADVRSWIALGHAWTMAPLVLVAGIHTCKSPSFLCFLLQSFLLTEEENSETSKARKARELGYVV